MAEDKKINIDLLINDAQAAKTWGESKKAIKDIKSAMTQLGDEGSADFLKLAAAAGEMNKKMKETTASIEAMSSAGAKVGALAAVGTKIAAGFEGAAAASALFGDKNKDVEKTLLKVQAAASMTRAIKEFAEFGETAKKAGVVLKAAFADNPLGLILIAITAVVGALAYFASANDKAAESQDEFNDRVEHGLKLLKLADTDLRRQAEHNTKLIKAKKLGLDQQYAAQTEEYKKEIELQKNFLKKLDSTIKEAEVKQKKIEKDGDEEKIKAGNQELTKLRDQYSTENQEYQKLKDSQSEADVAYSADSDERDKKEKEEKDKKAEEAYKKRLADNKKFNDQIVQENIDAIEDDEEREAAKADNEKRLRDREIKDSFASDDVKKKALIASQEKFNTDIKSIDAKYKKIKDDADAEAKKTKEELLRQAEEDAEKERKRQLEDNLKTIDDELKRTGLSYSERLDLLKAQAQAEIAIVKEEEERKTKLIQDEVKKRIAAGEDPITAAIAGQVKIVNATAQADQQINDINAKSFQDNYKAFAQSADRILAAGSELESGLQNLSDLTYSIKSSHLKKGSAEAEAAAKKNFEVNKAFQIASAVISGIKNTVTAFGVGIQAAGETGVGALVAPAVGAAYAAVAAIGAAASVAKISATQFQGGGSAGGNSFNSSTPNTPQGNQFSQQNLQQIGSGQPTINNPNAPKPSNGSTNVPTAQKVYVVSTDLTKSQNADAVLARRASFGPK